MGLPFTVEVLAPHRKGQQRANRALFSWTHEIILLQFCINWPGSAVRHLLPLWLFLSSSLLLSLLSFLSLSLLLFLALLLFLLLLLLLLWPSLLFLLLLLLQAFFLFCRARSNRHAFRLRS